MAPERKPLPYIYWLKEQVHSVWYIAIMQCQQSQRTHLRLNPTVKAMAKSLFVDWVRNIMRNIGCKMEVQRFVVDSFLA